MKDIPAHLPPLPQFKDLSQNKDQENQGLDSLLKNSNTSNSSSELIPASNAHHPINTHNNHNHHDNNVENSKMELAKNESSSYSDQSRSERNGHKRTTSTSSFSKSSISLHKRSHSSSFSHTLQQSTTAPLQASSSIGSLSLSFSGKGGIMGKVKSSDSPTESNNGFKGSSLKLRNSSSITKLMTKSIFFPTFSSKSPTTPHLTKYRPQLRHRRPSPQLIKLSRRKSKDNNIRKSNPNLFLSLSTSTHRDGKSIIVVKEGGKTKISNYYLELPRSSIIQSPTKNRPRSRGRRPSTSRSKPPKEVQSIINDLITIPFKNGNGTDDNINRKEKKQNLTQLSLPQSTSPITPNLTKYRPHPQKRRRPSIGKRNDYNSKNIKVDTKTGPRNSTSTSTAGSSNSKDQGYSLVDEKQSSLLLSLSISSSHEKADGFKKELTNQSNSKKTILTSSFNNHIMRNSNMSPKVRHLTKSRPQMRHRRKPSSPRSFSITQTDKSFLPDLNSLQKIEIIATTDTQQSQQQRTRQATPLPDIYSINNNTSNNNNTINNIPQLALTKSRSHGEGRKLTLEKLSITEISDSVKSIPPPISEPSPVSRLQTNRLIPEVKNEQHQGNKKSHKIEITPTKNVNQLSNDHTRSLLSPPPVPPRKHKEKMNDGWDRWSWTAGGIVILMIAGTYASLLPLLNHSNSDL